MRVMVVICVRIVDGGADLSRPRVSADWPGFVGNFLAEILGALARDCITLSSPNLRVIHLALSCVVGRVSRRVQSPQGSASALTRHEIPNIPKKKKNTLTTQHSNSQTPKKGDKQCHSSDVKQ